VLEFVQVVDDALLVVEPPDAELARFQHLAQLVADKIDDRLEIELGGHTLLDAVDHGELGGALLRLLEQALRLVEKARVLQRCAERSCHRRDQPDIRRRERVLAFEVLDADVAKKPVAHDDGHAQHRPAAIGARNRRQVIAFVVT